MKNKIAYFFRRICWWKGKARVYVFIDVANTWNIQKKTGKFIDYARLKKVLPSLIFHEKKYFTKVIKVFYYEAYPASGTRDRGNDKKLAFFHYLTYGLGFVVRKKKIKRVKVQKNNSIKEKGDMDIELAIDVLENQDQYDCAVFFTGDSDFFPLVTNLRNKGKKCFVFSSKEQVSTELKYGGDGYFDTTDYVELWGKALSPLKK